MTTCLYDFGPLGCGYVRLGRRPTSLLELIMEPETQALRGLTLVSAPEASSWPAFSVLRTSAQFPALSVAVDGGKFIELEQDFRVSARENEIMLFWDELGACVAYGGEGWRWLAPPPEPATRQPLTVSVFGMQLHALGDRRRPRPQAAGAPVPVNAPPALRS